MEPRFGAHFGGVRIHRDPRAAESARSVQAVAYTVGRHVVFDDAQYAPDTVGGRHLLAHELTHVIQQGAASPRGEVHEPTDRESGVLQCVSALDVAQGALDPKSLVGNVWLGLSRPVKLRLVNVAIDGADALTDAFPGQAQFGVFWDFVAAGLHGFYAALRTAAEDVKLLAIDKIALIMAGKDPAFALGYLKGLAKGFFIDGALGIFIAIYDLIKMLGKLWDFLKGIGEAIGGFPETMESLLERFINAGFEIAQGYQAALDQLAAILSDPTKAGPMLTALLEKGKTLAQHAGQSIAGSLLEFFSKPEASAEIGETAGNVAGQILWEVVFAVVTAGGGAAATAAKTALKTVVETLSKLLGKVVSGVLKIISELRALFVRAVEWVKAAMKFIKGKLSELCGRFAKLIEDVIEFFAKLLGSCHESKLFCDFEKVVAKLLKINKAQKGALKELAGKIHMLRGVLKGQAVAIVEVKVGSSVRYVAATNAGAGWAAPQLRALEELGVTVLKPAGKELVHAEPHVLQWVTDLRKGGETVDVLRWGVSAGEEGAHICYPCRAIIKSLGGEIEEFWW